MKRILIGLLWATSTFAAPSLDYEIVCNDTTGNTWVINRSYAGIAEEPMAQTLSITKSTDGIEVASVTIPTHKKEERRPFYHDGVLTYTQWLMTDGQMSTLLQATAVARTHKSTLLVDLKANPEVNTPGTISNVWCDIDI